VPIRLKRRARSEQVERFRVREVAAEAAPLRERLADWAVEHVELLAQARPAVPDELDDRAQDAVEPLLAIADLAADDWPQRARRAVVELRGGQDEDESIGIRLLGDVRAVFDRLHLDRIATTKLLDALAEDEEAPWRSYGHGLPLSPRQLARLLDPYDVRSRTIRLADGTTPKGYQRASFEDTWNRYLAPTAVSSRHHATTSMDRAIAAIMDPPQDETGEAPKPASAQGCGAVAPDPATQATRSLLVPGNPGFPKLLERALDGGHITVEEATERLWLHDTILRTEAAA
jgi:hypothetical protein